MSRTWLASDHHLGHSSTWEIFKRDDGTPLRNFSSTEEMDEYIIQQHNKVVKPGDKVYFLGDFVISKKHMWMASRFNGNITLIMGNHDHYQAKDYLMYFRNVRAFHRLDDFALGHIPIHSDSIGRWKAQIHGHTHARVVLDKHGKKDPRYISVCVERLRDYTPIDFEEIRAGTYTG